MTPIANFCLAECDFGDERLTKRAIKIGEAISLKYGQPLSQVFRNASDLKRTYEFLTNSKTTFNKVIQPIHRQTAEMISFLPIVLAFIEIQPILTIRKLSPNEKSMDR